jgi:hypothetical protein
VGISLSEPGNYVGRLEKMNTFRASSSAWEGFWARRGRGAMTAPEGAAQCCSFLVCDFHVSWRGARATTIYFFFPAQKLRHVPCPLSATVTHADHSSRAIPLECREPQLTIRETNDTGNSRGSRKPLPPRLVETRSLA